MLIYGAYIEEQNKLKEPELDIMKEDVNYYYKEGQKEVNNTLPLNARKSISLMPDSYFGIVLGMMNAQGYIWNEYQEMIMQYNAQQMYRQVAINIQQNKENDIYNNVFQNIIKKQQNTRLNINGDKISGAVDSQLIGMNNRAKVDGMLKVDNDTKVRFIAVEDKATTPMCHSLDGQIFSVNNENEFNRYYGETSKDLRIEKIKCKGLVIGLNLPPISHHFHYCRSTITYQVPVEKKEKTEYNVDNFLRTQLYKDKDYKEYINDYEKVRNEYEKLPDNIKKRLFQKEKVKVIFNYDGKHSGYNYQTKEILLNPNIEDGEFIHEVGHAIEYSLNIRNNRKYKEISNKLFENNYKEVKFDKDELYYGLQDETRFISPYQTYLGIDYNEYIKNYNNKFLRELISEGYRDIYSENSILEKTNKELYDFIKEIEENA